MDFPDYRDAWEAGAIRHGDAAGLAESMGVPAEALAWTLEETRKLAAGGSDSFGRDFTGKPPLGDDLYVVRVTGALFHTQGGLDIDDQARVMREADGVFPNLFAGGGAACGVSGSRVEGYLSGNGLLTAIGLGWVAGEAAARAAK
jgi:fumarate reductase flavoprotein subunit